VIRHGNNFRVSVGNTYPSTRSWPMYKSAIKQSKSLRLWENGVKKWAMYLGGRELGQWVGPAALVWPSSLQYAHRKFILAIFPKAETFLHTFCQPNKKYAVKEKTWYSKVWLVRHKPIAAVTSLPGNEGLAPLRSINKNYMDPR
jgi:hypothetical protein